MLLLDAALYSLLLWYLDKVRETCFVRPAALSKGFARRLWLRVCRGRLRLTCDARMRPVPGSLSLAPPSLLCPGHALGRGPAPALGLPALSALLAPALAPDSRPCGSRQRAAAAPRHPGNGAAQQRCTLSQQPEQQGWRASCAHRGAAQSVPHHRWHGEGGPAGTGWVGAGWEAGGRLAGCEGGTSSRRTAVEQPLRGCARLVCRWTLLQEARPADRAAVNPCHRGPTC